MLGEKFLQKKYRQKKPRLVTISILSLLESYESMLRTLKVLKPGETIVAADVDGILEQSLDINIYVKGGKSKTEKD